MGAVTDKSDVRPEQYRYEADVNLAGNTATSVWLARLPAVRQTSRPQVRILPCAIAQGKLSVTKVDGATR